LAAQQINATSFPEVVESIRADTRRRLAEGENEHLIFFILQSRSFTKLPPVEPALSALDFTLQQRVPDSAQARVNDFLTAKPSGERMVYLRRLLPQQGAREFILKQYRRTMGGLYAKEFEHSTDFYLTRGHSTDSNVAANYAVWNALRVVQATHPDVRIRRVLIVGPGLDFAPRTGFDDSRPPQSYQPFAVADALLQLGLSESPSIECVDINPRVIQYFERLPAEKKPLLEIESIPGEPEYMDYFARLGTHIGTPRNEEPLHKRIALSPNIVRNVMALERNIVTDILPGKYDLVIATNVLVYLDSRSLLLAIANIGGALNPGGLFVLNEIRPSIDIFATAAGLEPLQARTLRIAQGAASPLFDAFAVYRKTEAKLDTKAELK